MNGRWIAAGVVAWVCWAPVVSAQDLGPQPAQGASPTQATPPGAAKDVVRLKNGGLLRGTISEIIPGEKVVIVTVAGDVRVFSMAEVDYAGPSEGASKPAPSPSSNEPVPESTDQGGGETVRPYVTVNGPTAQLQLESEPAGMTFYRQAAAAGLVTGYERLCTAPCNITLPAGTEAFALGQEDEAYPRAAEAVAIPAGSSRLMGSYKSRAGIRTAGWIVAGGSLVVGTIMVVLSRGEKQECSYGGYCYDVVDRNYALLLGGTTLGLGGLVAGVWMAMTPNIAQVEVVPETPMTEKRRWAASGIVLKHKF